MANITFNSETYNAFLAEKKCCIATQVSEYIDAMYSASSSADCLLDELRENIYYLKFLEAGYIPVGDVLYSENGTCANYDEGIDYTGIFGINDTPTRFMSIYFYDLEGSQNSINFNFNPGVESGIGSPSYIEELLTEEFIDYGFNNVTVTVSYSYPNLNITIGGNNLIVYYIIDFTDEGLELYDYFTYSCEYVYASEDTNCLTDDEAVKMSNLIHCDCCN